MISLTTPAQINSVLGGNVPVSYDKLVITPFSIDVVNQSITGQLRLTSTATPDMPQIIGTLSIIVPSATLLVEIPQLDFYRRVRLTSPQNNGVLAIIEAAQKGIEDGLISLGVISGTRGPGG